MLEPMIKKNILMAVIYKSTDTYELGSIEYHLSRWKGDHAPKEYAIIVITVPSLYAILLPNCSIEQSQDTGGGEPTDVSKILNWPMV